jgi:gamma-glutamyltranspeptidase
MTIYTGRPATLAPQGMVASPHALASAAGVDVLRAGGSAVDAAIATSAALSVIYPHMTSVGGDAFWLIYDARAHRVRYLDGAGRAARSASTERLHAAGLETIPLRGITPATLTVPGAVASWCAAHADYGNVPLRRDLEAAIEYARNGFPVTQRLADAIAGADRDDVFNDHARRIFTPDECVPHVGEKLVNGGLSNVLERIAGGGAEGFYGGETAKTRQLRAC